MVCSENNQESLMSEKIVGLLSRPLTRTASMAFTFTGALLCFYWKLFSLQAVVQLSRCVSKPQCIQQTLRSISIMSCSP